MISLVRIYSYIHCSIAHQRQLNNFRRMNEPNAPMQANDLLKACQSFVVLDKRLNVFRFAHLSVDEYVQTRLRKVDSHAEIAKVCLSLLCTPSWNGYDTTLRTRPGNSNRQLLLYSVVFWPWHLANRDDGNDCQALTALWNTFISEINYHRWLDYHLNASSFTKDAFWHRSKAMQQKGIDILSLVCRFRLVSKFATVFESPCWNI